MIDIQYRFAAAVLLLLLFAGCRGRWHYESCSVDPGRGCRLNDSPCAGSKSACCPAAKSAKDSPCLPGCTATGLAGLFTPPRNQNVQQHVAPPVPSERSDSQSLAANDVDRGLQKLHTNVPIVGQEDSPLEGTHSPFHQSRERRDSAVSNVKIPQWPHSSGGPHAGSGISIQPRTTAPSSEHSVVDSGIVFRQVRLRGSSEETERRGSEGANEPSDWNTRITPARPVNPPTRKSPATNHIPQGTNPVTIDVKNFDE